MSAVEVMEADIDLIGSSTFGLHPKISPAQTWNMYVSDGWYEHYPGWKKIVDLNSSLGSAQGRGGLKSTRGNFIIVSVGDTLWRFDATETATLIGNIATHEGPVFMAENLNSQIAIVDGLKMYIYNRDNNTLTTQSVPGSLIPNYVKYHDSGFVVGNADTTGNGAQWFKFVYSDPENVVVAYTLALETKSDYARAVIPIPGKGNNVLVMGLSVAEIHTDVGGAQGYQRVSTINIDYGAVSVATIAALKTFVFWLAINEASVPVIVQFNGSEIKEVSTDGINGVLEKIQFPALSVGYLYSIGNHLFYVLTFYHPKDNKSYAYDVNQDKFYNISDWNYDFHPARMILYLNGSAYFISLKNGAIYKTSDSYLSQDENIATYPDEGYKFQDNHVIPQVRICSTFRKKGSIKGIGRRFNFTVEQGNDPTYAEVSAIDFTENIVTEVDEEDIVSQGGEQLVTQNQVIGINGKNLFYTPVLDFSMSKDGGVTYSASKFKKMNFYGHRQNIVNFDMLGQFNEITMRVKFWGFGRFTPMGGTFYYT